MRVTRLPHVPGFRGRHETLLYLPPLAHSPTPAQALVFFGGDIQDVEERMRERREGRRFLSWSLEAVAELLQGRLPTHHVLVVPPSRVKAGVVSCFDHWVQSDEEGVPSFSPDHGALLHLGLLLASLDLTLSTGGVMSEVELWLVGFSKGTVVLNQMVVEMAEWAEESQGVLSRLKRMSWLDGGHGGGGSGSPTWLTSGRVLAALAASRVQVDVHVTPYQVADPSRPWIGRQETIFSDTLARLGGPFRRQLHFNNLPPSLDNHFKLLQAFLPPPPPSPHLP